MKKIFLVIVMISVFLLSSCQTAVSPNVNSQANQDANNTEDMTADLQNIVTITTTTTTVPTTTANPYAEDFALLAQLTKEDGTGEISLDMEPDEVEAVLKKYNLDYLREYDYCTVHNEWVYLPYQYWIYGQIKQPQSYKGLKVGDSKSKVVEIYGEPDKSYTTSYGMLAFDYYTGTINDVYKSNIKFTVQMVNDLVTEMYVCIDIPEEEQY